MQFQKFAISEAASSAVLIDSGQRRSTGVYGNRRTLGWIGHQRSPDDGTWSQISGPDLTFLSFYCSREQEDLEFNLTAADTVSRHSPCW